MTDIAQMCEALRFLGRDRAKAARGTCYEAPAEQYVECRAADLIEKLSAAPPASVGRGDCDVEFVVQSAEGDFHASSNDRNDAEHYAAVYGRDGPVECKTAITLTFDGFLDHDAILSALGMPLPTPPEGEG